jgi:hypothetical protein
VSESRCDASAAYRSSENPVLSNHEFTSANGHIADFECFQQLLGKTSSDAMKVKRRRAMYLSVMVVDMGLAIVERDEKPGLVGMDVHAFDTIGSHGQLALDVETQRLNE